MHASSSALCAQNQTFAPTISEKPQNGIAGLRHWRHDLVAGLLVSLISLPFSLGIAVASGAPPICGLVSAIIAGLLLPFLGGSYVTVSGPAAGLAPILLASMTVLGRGDLSVGYPLLLCAICLAGCVQIVLSLFKTARFCALFPSSVVEGMLASIGLLIIAKQLPNFIGRPFHAHEFFEYLRELPAELPHLDPQVFLIGAACLVMIFALSAVKISWLKIVPPQVLAVVFGTVLGLWFHLDPKYLIHIPDNPLEHGFVPPNFAGLLADPSLWTSVLVTVVTLTLIDGIESLATVLAIDKIDPYQRKSDPNRTLLAMGVLNICSSIAGGLTIIPGGVKSKACIVGGGRTQWANFYNALFLLSFLFLARNAINLIPLSALAAVLIFTGYKLCEPRIWKHVAHIGREQLLVFSTTVVATLCTDLLWGIAAGIAAKLLLALWLNHSVTSRRSGEAATGDAAITRTALSRVRGLATPFRNPVARRESLDGTHHIYFNGPLVCFNMLHVNNELAKMPAGAQRICLHLTEGVTLVDHTSCENLLRFVDECHRTGVARVEILGMDQMSRRSEFPSCMRLGYTQLADKDSPALVSSIATGLTIARIGKEKIGSDGPATQPPQAAGGSNDDDESEPPPPDEWGAADPPRSDDSGEPEPRKPAWFEVGPSALQVTDPRDDLTWLSLSSMVGGTPGISHDLGLISLTEPARTDLRSHDPLL